MPNVKRQKLQIQPQVIITAILLFAGVFAFSNPAKAYVGLQVGTSTLILNNSENLMYGNINASSNAGSNLLLLQNASLPKFIITSSGNVGVGISNPNDIFSIGNAGSAPAGSDKTGHNYTSTYLSTDNYALANYGVVKTLINAATSSSALWGGTIAGNIWNLNSANVGIGTSSPRDRLEVNGNIVLSDYVNGKIVWNNWPSSWFLSSNTWQNNDVLGLTLNNTRTGINAIKFLTASGTSMVISSTGNVGIGTTAPAARLELAAGSNNMVAAKITGGYSGAAVLEVAPSSGLASPSIYLSGGSATYPNKIRSISDFAIETNGPSERIRITSSGNVGIGTTNPGTALEVDYNAWTTYGLRLKNTYTGGHTWDIGDGIDAMGYFSIYDRTATSSRFVINSSGNVGIGTTVPNDIFSIGNSGAAPAGSSNTGHNYTSTYLSSDDYALANYGIVKTLINAATSSSALWGGTTSGNIWNLNSANVGIGTTAPTSALSVVGDIDFSNKIYLNSTHTRSISNGWDANALGNTLTLYSNGILQFNNNGTIQSNSNGTLTLNTGTGNLLMTVGNVGIGTTSPSAKLQVAGTFRIDAATGDRYAQFSQSAVSGAPLNLSFGGSLTGSYLDITQVHPYYGFLIHGSGTWGGQGIQSDGTFGISHGVNTEDIAFYSQNFSGETMRIKGTGNVGIGTSTPIEKLSIFGGPDALSLRTSGLSTRFIFSTNWASGPGDYLGIRNSSVSSPQLMLTYTGNFGVGTTAPNDIFSIGNSGSAPAGSSNTGHNFTSTYLDSDNYALTNVGYVKSLISTATSTMSTTTLVSTIFLTATTTNGNLAYTGGYTGYDAGNKICNAAQAGSHFCRTDEIIYLIQLNGAASFSAINTQDAWIADGPPGFTGAVSADDCGGWVDGTNNKLGHFWIFASSGGGRGSLSSCDTIKKITCCK